MTPNQNWSLLVTGIVSLARPIVQIGKQGNKKCT
jgi:hypothetical protein